MDQSNAERNPFYAIWDEVITIYIKSKAHYGKYNLIYVGRFSKWIKKKPWKSLNMRNEDICANPYR